MINFKHKGNVVCSVNPKYISSINLVRLRLAHVPVKGEPEIKVEDKFDTYGIRYNQNTNEYYFPGVCRITLVSGDKLNLAVYDPVHLTEILSKNKDLLDEIDIDYFY